MLERIWASSLKVEVRWRFVWRPVLAAGLQGWPNSAQARVAMAIGGWVDGQRARSIPCMGLIRDLSNGRCWGDDDAG